MTTRFDYSIPESCWLALDYALLNGKCPECLSEDIDVGHSFEGGIFELRFECLECKLALCWGHSMSDREYQAVQEMLP